MTLSNPLPKRLPEFSRLGEHTTEWKRANLEVLAPFDSYENWQMRIDRAEDCKNFVYFSDHFSTRLKEKIKREIILCCRMCGSETGDVDPTDSNSRLSLLVFPLVSMTNWTAPKWKNIDVVCSACREGTIALQIKRPSAHMLMVQIRRSKAIDQLTLLDWLVSKYPDQAQQFLDRRPSRRPSRYF